MGLLRLAIRPEPAVPVGADSSDPLPAPAGNLFDLGEQALLGAPLEPRVVTRNETVVLTATGTALRNGGFFAAPTSAQDGACSLFCIQGPTPWIVPPAVSAARGLFECIFSRSIGGKLSPFHDRIVNPPMPHIAFGGRE